MQQTEIQPVSYGFDFVVVPEPSVASLVALGLVVLDLSPRLPHTVGSPEHLATSGACPRGGGLERGRTGCSAHFRTGVSPLGEEGRFRDPQTHPRKLWHDAVLCCYAPSGARSKGSVRGLWREVPAESA